MDSQLVNELAEHYRQRALRFTPKVCSQFGIRRDSVSLVIEELRLVCVPYEFQIDGGILVSSMSDREVELFLGRKQATTKVIVTRQEPGSEKPEIFHIPAHLTEVTRPKENSVYCLVRVQFIRLPHEIKEFLVTQFFKADQADAFQANLVEVPFDPEDIQHIFKGSHLSLQKPDAKAERLKILSFSVKTLQLFGEIEGVAPKVGDTLELVPYQGDRNCLVQGVCTKRIDYPEAPGFFLIQMAQTLSYGVIDKLMKMAKTAKTPFLAPRVENPKAEPPTKSS